MGKENARLKILSPWTLPLCMTIWLALGSGAAAQTPTQITVQAVRLLPGEVIKVDGTLAHPAWRPWLRSTTSARAS